jgi:DNA/RNA endonuclease YhcR with UshA esterase domain
VLEYGTNVLSIVSGAITIDASLSGNHKVVLTSNITSVTVVNMLDGQTIQVLFKQDGTGSRTVAFGATIKFVGGTAPTITTTANHGDVISISQFDGQLIGAVAVNASL